MNEPTTPPLRHRAFTTETSIDLQFLALEQDKTILIVQQFELNGSNSCGEMNHFVEAVMLIHGPLLTMPWNLLSECMSDLYSQS